MRAEKVDLPALRKLWEYCFYDDSKEFLDFHFGSLDPSNVRVIKDGGKIVSCLHLQYIDICQNGKIYKAAYIGGVSTAPEYRGMGFYKRLMNETLDELALGGCDAAMLIPFSFDFYRKDGFEVSSYYIEVSGKLSDLGKSRNSQDIIYDAYWKRTSDELENIKSALAPDGMRFFEGGGFHVFYYFSGDTVTVPEICAKTAEGYEAALSFVASHSSTLQRFKIRTDVLRAPRFSERCFDVKLCPHTMMRILNPELNLKGVYNNNFNLLGYV